MMNSGLRLSCTQAGFKNAMYNNMLSSLILSKVSRLKTEPQHFLAAANLTATNPNLAPLTFVEISSCTLDEFAAENFCLTRKIGF
jgi:hypothetical protein